MAMKRIRKTLLVLLSIILVAVFAAACSKSGGNSATNSEGAPSSGNADASPSAAQVTIKYAQFSGAGDNEKYLMQMKDEFESQNPNIKVDIETIAFGDYFTQMQTRVAAGNAPDAYELNYENFVSYAKKGVLQDLAPLFGGFDPSALNEKALSAFAADGVQYGLPASFSNVLLFYNKDLFDRANVAYPTNDWTWKEMDDAAVKIRALGEDIFGVFQPVQFWEFYKTVQQNGGSLFNDDMTKFTFNTPQNVETLQHLADRLITTNTMPTQAQLSGVGDWDLFKAGRLGMIITGVWAFPDFVANVEFPWDVAVEPGNVNKATHFFSNGLVISKDSKQKEAAFKWIQFMSASKEAAQIRVDANWELPAVTDTQVLEAFLQATPPDNRQAVFDSLNYLVTPPVIEQFAEMTDIVGIHLAAAAEGAKSPQQALDDAQKELEQKINLQ